MLLPLLLRDVLDDSFSSTPPNLPLYLNLLISQFSSGASYVGSLQFSENYLLSPGVLLICAPLFSILALVGGKGLSLKTKRRTKLKKDNIPKNTKQPNHPKYGRIKLLATMPTLAAIALPKYKMEYTFDPSLYKSSLKEFGLTSIHKLH